MMTFNDTQPEENAEQSLYQRLNLEVGKVLFDELFNRLQIFHQLSLVTAVALEDDAFDVMGRFSDSAIFAGEYIGDGKGAFLIFGDLNHDLDVILKFYFKIDEESGGVYLVDWEKVKVQP